MPKYFKIWLYKIFLATLLAVWLNYAVQNLKICLKKTRNQQSVRQNVKRCQTLTS